MKKSILTVLMGIGVWIVPFALGMLLLSVRQSNPALFDSLMAVSLCAASVLFFSFYQRLSPQISASSAAAVGLLWAAICVAIDLPLFTQALGMSSAHYFSDIGATYLMIPLIAVGMANAAQRRRSV